MCHLWTLIESSQRYGHLGSYRNSVILCEKCSFVLRQEVIAHTGGQKYYIKHWSFERKNFWMLPLAFAFRGVNNSEFFKPDKIYLSH